METVGNPKPQTLARKPETTEGSLRTGRWLCRQLIIDRSTRQEFREG